MVFILKIVSEEDASSFHPFKSFTSFTVAPAIVCVKLKHRSGGSYRHWDPHSPHLLNDQDDSARKDI